MPIYEYRARDIKGALIKGTVDGSSMDAIAEQLSSQGYIPVKITEKKTSFELPVIFGRVKYEDLIVFSRQLATLVTSGISFTRSLDTLEEQTKNKRLKEVIRSIRKDIEGGSSFSDALSKYPSVFPPLYVSMIRVGEEGGVLDEVLERLASLLEHEAQTRARIKTAVRYPVIVVIAICIAFIVLTSFVIPKFAAIYASAKVTLPWPTRVLILINVIISKYWFLLLGGIAGIVLLIRYYLKTPSGSWQWDNIKLKLPIFGPLIHKTVMSRFSRVFSTLYRSGIPLISSLDIVAQTLGNQVISRAVGEIKNNVREGKGLATPMKTLGVFPPMVIQMVGVGEETGALDTMLNKVSDYYDLEVEYAIRNLATTLEPVLLLFIGGMVLFLALGIFLPIWDMISVIKK